MAISSLMYKMLLSLSLTNLKSHFNHAARFHLRTPSSGRPRT